MATAVPTMRFPGLTKRRLGEVRQRAEERGMTVEQYVEELIEQDLSLEQKARTTTFSRLMGPGRKAVNDAEVDRLVDRARTAHHQRSTKRKG